MQSIAGEMVDHCVMPLVIGYFPRYSRFLSSMRLCRFLLQFRENPPNLVNNSVKVEICAPERYITRLWIK